MADETVKVFVSHSWRDRNTPEGLEIHLDSGPIELLYDRAEIAFGDDLPLGIERMLDECDVLLGWITSNSLASTAVREELARAHERRIPMVLVVESDVRDRLPPILRDKIYIPSSGLDMRSIAPSIQQTILERREYIKKCALHKQIATCHKHLAGIIGSGNIPERGLSSMLYLHARNEVKHCVDTLRDLENPRKIQANLDTATAFLSRCKDVFGQADRLVAVSRDDVSEFWLSKNKPVQNLVAEYLQTNPVDTIRMFVFKDALEAHLYHHWLNIHQRFYGREGAVLVISREAFEKLLNDFGIDDDLMKGVDFGLARYAVGKGHRWYLAKLGGGQFSVMPWGDELPERFHRFIDAVEHHARNLVPGTSISNPGIGRWTLDLHKNSAEYAEFLRGVFPDVPSSIVHVVLCKPASEELSEFKSYLHSGVRAILDSVNSRHTLHAELERWTVLTSVDPVFHDPYTHGRLQVSEEWPVALIMRFRSEHGLRLWHEQLKHSQVRRGVLEFLCPETKPLFEQIDQVSMSFRSDHERARIFAEIQATACDRFVRFEFCEVLDFEEIVGIRVPPPQVWITPDRAVVEGAQ